MDITDENKGILHEYPYMTILNYTEDILEITETYIDGVNVITISEYR